MSEDRDYKGELEQERIISDVLERATKEYEKLVEKIWNMTDNEDIRKIISDFNLDHDIEVSYDANFH